MSKSYRFERDEYDEEERSKAGRSFKKAIKPKKKKPALSKNEEIELFLELGIG